MSSNSIGQTSQPTPLDEPDFYVAELQRAVSEQRFGVTNIGNVAASVPPSSPGATVNVELLEQRTIKIKLTLHGFRVVSMGSASHGRVFETIEGLLEEESPLWAEKRMVALMSKLTGIAGMENTT